MQRRFHKTRFIHTSFVHLCWKVGCPEWYGSCVCVYVLYVTVIHISVCTCSLYPLASMLYDVYNYIDTCMLYVHTFTHRIYTNSYFPTYPPTYVPTYIYIGTYIIDRYTYIHTYIQVELHTSNPLKALSRSLHI